ADYNVSNGTIVVDWLRAAPYVVSTGTFHSRVFDAGVRVNWSGVEWTGVTPAGTSLTITVCTSDTLTAAGALENPGCSSGLVVSPQGLSSMTSRYLQYRAELATGNSAVTPELSDIRIAGSAPTVITTEITWATPANISYGTALGATQ